jgi:hypothetical protein
MRLLILTAAAALAACSTAMHIGADPGGAASASHSAWPFPQAPRGSALPPPQARATQTAPPEGRTPGGLDFGHWRTASAPAYANAFETQITAREQGRDAAGVKADLEANGFACDNGARLDCRIEINENQCLQDWYVVLDGGAVHAGYEKSCPVRGGAG